MSSTLYDAIPAVRRSDLWEIRKSPLHYLYAVTHRKEPTASLLFGIAAHKYILEPETFWDDYVLAPEVDRRTKDGKAEWNRFLMELNETGKESLSITDYATIQDMQKSVMGNDTAAALLTGGKHEVPIQWMDAATGELCKIRPDCITEYEGKKYIVDYKTTTSCEPGAFERSCRYYGYKLQAGMYTEGLFCTTLEKYHFAFVAQEKDPPYATRVYFCDSGFVEEGIQMFHDLIEIYHECWVNDKWPGYEERTLFGDE